MLDSSLQLNLARKWRSKTFDEIIGQELVVRLLKNSLYKSSFFPAYLLCGMRGCGKTSIGRLFAAALNCEQLELFRKSPTEFKLPCYSCRSCILMKQNQHPDFVEIDAASNTGVDNIRNIIDNASFVPVVGTKKIYLIDEAHMLSKAAFNAFLKILEEPPLSVIFMLATTDPQKIIDTVRSRCFQLFFTPIESNILKQHLINICNLESIACETEALDIIVEQSEGSVRDALNLIERLRLGYKTISQTAVLETLGFIDNEKLIKLFETVFSGSRTDILNLNLELKLETYNTQLLWKKFVELIRASIFIKNGIEPESFISFKNKISLIINKFSHEKLIYILELFYNYEFSLTKTITPYRLFEVILIKLNQELSNNINNNSSSNNNLNNNLNLENINNNNKNNIIENKDTNLWQDFLKLLDDLEDPLVSSVFKQARFILFDNNKKLIEIGFSQNLTFFKDLLDDTKLVWQKILEKKFGKDIICNYSFNDPVISNSPQTVSTISPVIPAVTTTKVENKNNKINNKFDYSSSNTRKSYTKQNYSQAETYKKSVVITDPANWPKATMLLKIFPGNITQN